MAMKKGSRAATASKSAPSAVTTLDRTQTVFVAQCQAACSLIALAFTVVVIQSELAPLFGGAATRLLLNGTVAALLVSFSFAPSLHIRGLSNATLFSIILILGPFSIRRLGAATSRWQNPVLGPPLAYLPVLMPAAYFSMDSARNLTVSTCRTV